MSQSASYDDPDFRMRERALGRRRLVASVVLMLGLTGIASGSAVAAVAAGQDAHADAHGTSLVVSDRT